MRPTLVLCLLILAAPLLLTAEDGNGPPPKEPPSRRLLLVPAAGGGLQARDALHAQAGATRVRRLAHVGGIEVVTIDKGRSLAEAKAAYEASGRYRSVEYDRVVSVVTEPDDPSYLDTSLWGLNNTGQAGGLADADIDAPEAWAVRTDASEVVVAVIDTGVRLTHEDLAANLWTNAGEIPGNGVDDDGNGVTDDVHGYNAIAGTGDPSDDNGHGTHCAGTIGAVGNNGVGVVGACWSVQIMALKFLSADGTGNTSDAIECIDYAVAKGADIISNSWGSAGNPDTNTALVTAVTAARTAGIIFVAAAGNDGSDNDQYPFSPANLSLDNVVTVAATDRNDHLASFSNFGASTVDLGAPGVSILSCGHDADDSYVVMSGTSMACPLVAGALALGRAQHPGDSHQDLIARLKANVDLVPALTGRCATHGRLNLYGLLTGTTSPPPPTNDDFADRQPLAGEMARAAGRSHSATLETGEPVHGDVVGTGRSLWWTWTAPATGPVQIHTRGSDFNTVLAVYTGDELASLTPVASNDDDPAGGTQSLLEFSATAGSAYRIAVAGKSGTGGTVLLTVSRYFGNDDVADAIPLSGCPVVAYGNNDGATAEPGEPDHGDTGGFNPSASIWYRWTAPGPYTYLFTTLGSSGIDTTLGIYSGTPWSSYTTHAQNDDKDTGLGILFSEAAVGGVEGTELLIAVDGYAGDTGDIVLTIADNSNDDFADARVLDSGVLETTDLATNAATSKETGEPTHVTLGYGASVWWSWTAPADGVFTVTTLGSGFDTVLAVYTGGSVGALSEVASNDDVAGGVLTSRVVLDVTAGTTYRIAVDGYSWSPTYAALRTGLVKLATSFQPTGVRTITLATSVLDEILVSDELGDSRLLVPGGTAVFGGRMPDADHTFELELAETADN